MGKLAQGVAITTVSVGSYFGFHHLPEPLAGLAAYDKDEAVEEVAEARRDINLAETTVVSLGEGACTDLGSRIGDDLPSEELLPTDPEEWQDIIRQECPELDDTSVDQTSRLLASYALDLEALEGKLQKFLPYTKISVFQRATAAGFGGAVAGLGLLGAVVAIDALRGKAGREADIVESEEQED